MNKRTKIIVSIVGITIVLLALLGITYAYYLTRIEGNTNTNSISITTAKLELTYGDGNGMLLPYGTIEPNSDESIKFYKTDASGNPITNEPPVDNKTFTVTNNGNDSSYVVIIDNVSVTKASDGSRASFVSNDFRYTLSCTKSDGTNCNDVSDLTIFPIKGGILVSNDIKAEDVHTYTLTMWYIDTGIDQSDDMGKSLQARVNIADVNQMENPFMTGVTATDNASLAYNIIKNAKEKKNGTELTNTPLTNPAETISGVTNYKTTVEDATFAKSMDSVSSYASKTWYYYDTYEVNATTGRFTLSGKHSCTYNSTTTNTDGETVNCYDDMVNKYLYDTSASKNSKANKHTAETITDLSNVYKVTSATATTLNYVKVVNSPNEAERVLAPTTDDYGTSYYYRGDVEDNYVNFAGMCWRIVRIEGDGSVKLTLESQSVCSEDMESNFSIGEADWGYKNGEYSYIGDYKNSTTGMKNLLTTWFDTNFKSDGNLTNAGLKIKNEEWCLSSNDKVYTQSGSSPNYIYTLLEEPRYTSEKFYYDSYVRLVGNANGYQPTLKCNGEKDTSKIGALTADEVVYAGGKAAKAAELNNNYYLQNDNYYWWTLSRAFFYHPYDFTFDVRRDGSLGGSRVDRDTYRDVRPAVSLNTGVKITGGEGTRKNPYIIDEE